MIFLKKFILYVAISIIAMTVLLVLTGTFLYFYSRSNIDRTYDERLFSSANQPNISHIYVNSAPLFSGLYIPSELKVYSNNNERKSIVKIDDISEYVILGFISTEDREFYQHDGVNLRRTIGAFLNSIFKFEKRFGASTITQQVIKNISGDNEITFKRKLNEIIRAYLIEKNHSKNEILELYLNIVPMSERCVGIGMGSKVYFDKDPKDLSLSEAALLVGITNAPSKFNPYIDKEAAINRRNTVLSNMYDCGFISDFEYNAAKNEDLILAKREINEDKVYSWFYETVFEDIIKDLSSTCSITEQAARAYLNAGGLSIYTTMNKNVQDILEAVVSDRDNFSVFFESDLKTALVVIDNQRGEILGIVGQGGIKTANRILNYATVNIPPASTIKPLSIYAPLIEEGVINYSTAVDDAPISIKEDIPYPKNSPNVYDGVITLNEAVKKSKNTVSVRLYEKINKERIYNYLRDNLYFSSLDEKNDKSISALALGQLYYGTSLRSLTNAYTVFPNEGMIDKEVSYLYVIDNKNNTVLENKKERKRIYSESTARIMNQILSEVVMSGTARSLKIKETLDVAGKTGTSSGCKDRIFIGYTPYVTVGVWVGYGDGVRECPMDRQYHLELFDICAKEIHKDLINDTKIKYFSTEGLIKSPFCLDSGQLIKEDCLYDKRGERVGYGYYTENNMPLYECKRHVWSLSDNRSYLTPIERDYKEKIYINDEEFFLNYSSV